MLHSSRKNKRGLSLPDMAPFAGLIFLIVVFYALSSSFKRTEFGIVSNDQLPFSEIRNRGKIPENCTAITSLDTENQLSFAVDCPAIQSVAIQQVALQHGVNLTFSQKAELKTLPFLATAVENLPELLSLHGYQYRQVIELNSRAPLNEQQLAECLAAAKSCTKTLLHTPIYFAFKISPEVRMAHVIQLFDLHQSLGINRFTLLTQGK